MRTNPFYDAWLFLIGATEDHINSGVGYFLVILFLVLIAGSILIVLINWREDSNQRTIENCAICFMRIMIGCMWFQGSLWKLPLPVSGAFQYWTEELSHYAAFGWHRWLATNVFLPLIKFIDPLVYLTELSFGIAFILGFMVRPLAVIGILFVLHIWLGLYHHPNEWPWLYIFLVFVQGFFIVNDAGKSLGLDALLSRKPIGPFVGDGRIARLYRRLA
jgi:uncharacterized membrane protein YphA (DoxX/SURF4 family)